MVWGRGTGDGIGLSNHKGEYSAGVRCGNWVEEKFGAEANGENQDALKAFMVAREAADVAKWGAKLDTAGVARIEPKGSTANPGVNAVMTKSYYYGIKHIDFVALLGPERALGAHDAQGERVEENAAPRRPGAGDGSMYLSDSARMGLRMAPLAGKSWRFQFGYE